MKIKTIWFLSLLVTLVLASCEDDAVKVTLKENVEANELQNLSKQNYVLSLEDASKLFEKFVWKTPDYGFQASESYTVQLDKAGNNFAVAIEVLSTLDTSAAITVGDLNKKLLDLGFTPGEPANVEVRVRSIINDNVKAVYSTVLTLTLTPYATIFPPIYMIGDATGGWDLGKAVEVKSIAPSKYETVAQFTQWGKFRFFASASWDAKTYNWATFVGGTVDTELSNGQDSDGNFLVAGVSGWYKITIDTKNKTLVLEATEKPALFMIGDAVQGWDLAKAVELTRVKDGLFQTTTTFTSGNIFRFFTAADWGKGTINYTYFSGGTVTASLANNNDGDKNFKVVAASGSYKITVDLVKKTVVMESQ